MESTNLMHQFWEDTSLTCSSHIQAGVQIQNQLQAWLQQSSMQEVSPWLWSLPWSQLQQGSM